MLDSCFVIEDSGEVDCPVLGSCYELESLYRHILWKYKSCRSTRIEQTDRWSAGAVSICVVTTVERSLSQGYGHKFGCSIIE